ncbi:MAG TPA: DUF4389 domain-containing protein [Gallionellaceae bacterium]
MTDNTDVSPNRRNTWIRGLYMVLMALILHISVTLLFVIAIIQFILALLGDAPNERLKTFGRNLGIYFRQIANFLTFASEELPFPFSDWPSGD